jgi:hypothetical protein
MKITEFERKRLLGLLKFARYEFEGMIQWLADGLTDDTRGELLKEQACQLETVLRETSCEILPSQIRRCFKLFEMVPSGGIMGIEEVERGYLDFKKHMNRRMREEKMKIDTNQLQDNKALHPTPYGSGRCAPAAYGRG